MGRFVILHHQLPARPHGGQRRAGNESQKAGKAKAQKAKRSEGDSRNSHWDLMLEWYEGEHGLRTWALEQTPCEGSPVVARELAVHRRQYLDYEGPVSGNRGRVEQWDRGEFEVARDEQHAVEVNVRGDRLRGTLLLEHLREDHWRLTFSSRFDE